MRVSRLAIFGVAGVAAAGAGLVAVNLAAPPPPEPVLITAQPSEPPIKLVDVLAASRDIGMGERVDDALEWVQWPESAASGALLRRDQKPNALEEVKGSIARQAFFTGEPIREAKLVKSDRGFLSAILPEGKRAIAVQITADTSAGGFILPNDHVDVIMAREKAAAVASQANGVETTTILKNLRVLAIDQQVEEKDGTRVVVGSTATLEVDPQQAEALTAATRMTDRLILSLRSLADSVPGSPGYARFLLEQEQAPQKSQIRVVRYGKTTDVTTRN
jgi:pilus assembly protein CpaB